MNTSVDSTAEFIEAVYRKMDTGITGVRARLNRPLTYAEKVLYGHLDSGDDADLTPGTSYIKTRPDRIAPRTPPPRWPFCSSCSRARTRLPYR